MRGAHVNEVLEQEFFAPASTDLVDSIIGQYRIAMNPPFSQGRWQSHVEAAAGLLSSGGKLVAVIPASGHGKFSVKGLNVVYDGPHDNQFSGTSTSVTILIGEKP